MELAWEILEMSRLIYERLEKQYIIIINLLLYCCMQIA